MEDADSIASAVLEQFRKLPAKRKPAVRDNGLHEWVPLSGIIVKGPNILRCVALATGMKCLPVTKLPQANGFAIHDWHAEILTLRSFNRFLLDECRRLAQDSSFESDYLRRRTPEEWSNSSNASSRPRYNQPFVWREDLTLHMYCSEAPCGDASMELIMSAQADATPWTIPPSLPPTPSPPTPSNPSPPQTNTSQEAPTLLGRGYFSHLGIVRRKPSRPDAPPTASKSCSDKLALKQCTSLLSSLTSLFVSPRGVYLTSIVLPASQYSDVACRRCFGGSGEGRMAGVDGKVWEEYKFSRVRIGTVEGEFEFSRMGIKLRNGTEGVGEVKVTASNLAVAWTVGGEVDEGLIGGVLQGRKAFDLKGASMVSRWKMWAAAVEIAEALGEDEISQALAKGSYGEVKEGELLEGRRKVKDEVRGGVLKGWLRNAGDGGFGL